MIVYCDAAGPGHIDFVAICDGIRNAGNTHLPSWIAKLAVIYEFELAIAIYAVHAASLLWPGRPILLCADNSAAASTLLRRNCTPPFGGSLASVFWTAAAAYRVPVWVEEVRPKYSIADPPSRCFPLFEKPVNFTRLNLGLPDDVFAETFKSHASHMIFRLEGGWGWGWLKLPPPSSFAAVSLPRQCRDAKVASRYLPISCNRQRTL